LRIVLPVSSLCRRNGGEVWKKWGKEKKGLYEDSIRSHCRDFINSVTLPLLHSRCYIKVFLKYFPKRKVSVQKTFDGYYDVYKHLQLQCNCNGYNCHLSIIFVGTPRKHIFNRNSLKWCVFKIWTKLNISRTFLWYLRCYAIAHYISRLWYLKESYSIKILVDVFYIINLHKVNISKMWFIYLFVIKLLMCHKIINGI